MTGCMCCIPAGRFGRRGVERLFRRTDFQERLLLRAGKDFGYGDETSGKLVASYAGSITVRSYPRFNAQVSTLDIKNGISEYRKLKGYNPDIVIVDSMDLLTDANRRSWGADHERAKRIAVANDLKDLAADEKVWMVVTYQSTIEDREWLNDERNVLTEYNCSEAKGLARPCTHLVSLNQSSAERKENVMRLHVAKSRFFQKGDTIRIATDYDNEVFYDGQRTLNLNRE